MPSIFSKHQSNTTAERSQKHKRSSFAFLRNSALSPGNKASKHSTITPYYTDGLDLNTLPHTATGEAPLDVKIDRRILPPPLPPRKDVVPAATRSTFIPPPDTYPESSKSSSSPKSEVAPIPTLASAIHLSNSSNSLDSRPSNPIISNNTTRTRSSTISTRTASTFQPATRARVRPSILAEPNKSSSPMVKAFSSSTFGPSTAVVVAPTLLPPASRVPSPLDFRSSSSTQTMSTSISFTSEHGSLPRRATTVAAAVVLAPQEEPVDLTIPLSMEYARPPSRSSFKDGSKRLSRRLSIDGIMGSLRRRPSLLMGTNRVDKSSESRRWSAAGSPGIAPSGVLDTNKSLPNRNDNAGKARRSLALPSIRTLRNKFSVRPGVGKQQGLGRGIPASAVPVSRDDVVEEVPVMGGDENQARRTPKDTTVPQLGGAPLKKIFVPRSIPLYSPNKAESTTVSASTSMAVAAADTPTPLFRRGEFSAPNTRITIDRSPLGATAQWVDSTSQHHPLTQDEENDIPVIPIEGDQSSSLSSRDNLESSDSSLSIDSSISGRISRKQSLSELREAVRRMRDLTGTRGDTDTSTLDSGSKRSNDSNEMDHIAAPRPTRIGLSTRSSGNNVGPIDGLPSSRSNRSMAMTMTPLQIHPRSHPLRPSRSKSTTALSTLASAFNLVESTQRKQGSGWWSANPDPPLPVFNTSTSSIRNTPTRKAGGIGNIGLEETRLEVLERLAKSATLPCRQRFEFDSPKTPVTPNRRYGRSAFVDSRGSPGRSIRFAKEPSSARSASRFALQEQQGLTPQTGGSERRPSILRSGGTGGAGIDDTRATPSRRASSPGRTEVSRRVSWHINQPVSAPKTHRPGTPKSRIVSPAVESYDWRKELAGQKAKHALETDALLSALSTSKMEENRLRKEVEGLHQLLAEGILERKTLRLSVEKLAVKMEEREQQEMKEKGKEEKAETEKSGHRKKSSLGLAIRGADELLGPYLPETHESPMMPNLRVDILNSIMNVSPLAAPALPDSPPQHPVAIQVKPANFSSQNQSSRQTSASTWRSRTSSGSNIDDNWELKLKSADERHLDDL